MRGAMDLSLDKGNVVRLAPSICVAVISVCWSIWSSLSVYVPVIVRLFTLSLVCVSQQTFDHGDPLILYRRQVIRLARTKHISDASLHDRNNV